VKLSLGIWSDCLQLKLLSTQKILCSEEPPFYSLYTNTAKLNISWLKQSVYEQDNCYIQQCIFSVEFGINVLSSQIRARQFSYTTSVLTRFFSVYFVCQARIIRLNDFALLLAYDYVHKLGGEFLILAS